MLKAALLYADRVELVSVGASFMASLDNLGAMPMPAKLALMRRLMPIVEPGASVRELDKINRLIDSVTEKLVRHRRLAPEELPLLLFLKEKWSGIEDLVEAQFEQWGADGFRIAFRIALRSGLLEIRPFASTSPDAILDMAMAEGPVSTEPFAEEAYDEYVETVLGAVNNGTTYPLFDDLTGDVVGRAVRSGLISPTPGARKRGKHGGLSGDLLRRLPLFERASISEVLDIRKELATHLGAFREAVADSSATIESAAWERERFAEEAEIVFREKVTPAVKRIERRVRDERSLKELSYAYGPFAVAGGASSLGAFLGSGSALAGIAVLAANLVAAGYHGKVAAEKKREKVEGERLYFYYRAGRAFGWRRR